MMEHWGLEIENGARGGWVTDAPKPPQYPIPHTQTNASYRTLPP